MKAVVRASKFRHLFGTVGQSDEQLRNVRLGTGISPESNVLKANPTYLAFPWFTPGAVCVVPLAQKSAIAEEPPLITHDAQPVLEMNFSPFNDSLLLTACQDGVARIFQVPENAARSVPVNEAVVNVQASAKRLVNAEFHPTVENVLLTVSGEHELKLWDVAAPDAARCTLAGAHKGIVTSVAWNLDGAVLCTSCKDKQLRIVDPRNGAVVAETKDHEGAKSGRVVWNRNRDRIISVGFTKTSERHINVFDPRALAKPLSTVTVDASSASPMPFLDEDLSIVYLAGKGEGQVKLFELDESSQLHLLGEFKSNVPCSGMAQLPKFTCNRAKNEVMRFLKLTTSFVVPLRFEVPRQTPTYQEDLYPPTIDRKPALDSAAWFTGKTSPPPRVALPPVAIQ